VNPGAWARTGDERVADAVTLSFGELDTGLFGLVRGAVAGGRASALALVLHQGVPVLVQAEEETAAPAAGLADLRVGAVRLWRAAPERWGLALEGDGVSLELELEALGPAAHLDAAGGQAQEQLCSVRGMAAVGHERLAVSCLGQRARAPGALDWTQLALERSVAAWLGEDRAVAVHALRPAGALDHEAERSAGVLRQDEEVVALHQTRLSSTYDGSGRQRRAGLELWLTEEDDFPRRAAGEVVCGTSVELGALRLDCAFLRWHMDGRQGAGRYDVLRPA